VSQVFEDALSLRASGHVARWHTVRTITRQSVAEHSGQAVTLLLLLHPGPSLNLVKAMNWHDGSERLVGDVPAPIRREFKAFAQMYEELELVVAMRHHPSAVVTLTDDERDWLKTIDVLELFLHCHDEARLGNAEFRVIQGRARDYLWSSSTTPEIVREFVLWFEEEGQTRRFV
jgi:5'-deoxynucleotidase YfbR-like HD superfamily hydrolase